MTGEEDLTGFFFVSADFLNPRLERMPFFFAGSTGILFWKGLKSSTAFLSLIMSEFESASTALVLLSSKPVFSPVVLMNKRRVLVNSFMSVKKKLFSTGISI